MEEATPTQTFITKDFLEKLLKREIASFKVSEGTKPGDNFTSVLVAIEVSLTDKKDPLHLLMKIFPHHPERQKFLENTNVFRKELQIYDTWLPELINFQKELVGNEPLLKPAMAELVGGAAIDYTNDSSHWKDLDPMLSNFILMVDVRKTYGFQMADKLKGLGYHHVKVILEELAKYHALGHAYRIHHKLPNIRSKFPFMKDPFFDNPGLTTILEGIIKDHMQLLKTTCADVFKEKPELAKSYEKFMDPVLTTEYMCMFMKPGGVDGEKVENLMRVKPQQCKGELMEEQWIATGHGDCWSNNMLFKTDQDGKVTATVMVDLQVARECSIMADIVHFLYMSTDTEFRKKYLDEMLLWYHDRFVNFCTILKVDTFPGFSSDNLRRRFHKWKVFGFLYAAYALPIVLRRPEATVNMDTLDVSEEKANNDDVGGGASGEGDDKLVKMFRKAAGDDEHKNLLRHIFTNLMLELHEEGVL